MFKINIFLSFLSESKMLHWAFVCTCKYKYCPYSQKKAGLNLIPYILILILLSVIQWREKKCYALFSFEFVNSNVFNWTNHLNFELNCSIFYWVHCIIYSCCHNIYMSMPDTTTSRLALRRISSPRTKLLAASVMHEHFHPITMLNSSL